MAKAIYAEAFKDASNFNRFAIAPGFRDLDNPDLPPERVENLELSLGRTMGDLEWSVAAYQADYSDAVVQRQVPFGSGTTLRNQAAGELRIRGLQGTGRYRRDALELWTNYTYTDPESTNFLGRDGLERAVRVGDIARHRVNLGGYYRWRERLGLSARLHWVGDRPTGPGTTVEANPFREIEAYTELDLALTWHRVARGLDLQLAVDNVLDDLHYHPGTGAATGDLAAAVLTEGCGATASRLLRGESAQVMVMVDGSDSSVAGQAVNVASAIGLEESLRRVVNQDRGPAVDVRPKVMFNPDSRSPNFFLPGLIAVLMLMITTMLTAFSVVREKERGTLEQLMVTPIQPLGLMLILTAMFSIMAGRAPSEGYPYAVFAYTGLLAWSSFASAVSSGSAALVTHASLLTRVSVPREILPLTYVAAALQSLLNIARWWAILRR